MLGSVYAWGRKELGVCVRFRISDSSVFSMLFGVGWLLCMCVHLLCVFTTIYILSGYVLLCVGMVVCIFVLVT